MSSLMRALAVIAITILVGAVPCTVTRASFFKNDESTSTQLTVNPSNRVESLTFYHNNYRLRTDVTSEWTGSQTDCTPGTISEQYKAQVLRRVNYFRAMAGVPATITLNADYNRKAQAAALMMSVNNERTHYPPTTWACYTADGAQGAKSSNLSQRTGWEAIDSYMRDLGPNNFGVGHRKWLLYPQTQQMGIGDVPGLNGYMSANALWVLDTNYWGSRPVVREEQSFVAWPPRGYIPYTVVYPRWSFSYPSADFSNTSVTMKLPDGSFIPLTIEPLNNVSNENTLVWRPYHRDSAEKWPKPMFDEGYEVTIHNVIINNILMTFTYSVTIIDDGELPPGFRIFLPLVRN